MFLDHTRRKIFVSFFQGDRHEVDDFIFMFAHRERIFIPKALGVSSNDDFINSTNTDYVMGEIRRRYLGDSTVTVLLTGRCTHSRRYVDWELKSSLRRGSFVPNGLLGILLPSAGPTAHLPPRFNENWSQGEHARYALFRGYPSSGSELANWIEAAHRRRTSHASLIANSADMMRHNAMCRVHSVTH